MNDVWSWILSDTEEKENLMWAQLETKWGDLAFPYFNHWKARKTKIVKFWVDQTMTLGMSSSQRVEGFHHVCDPFMNKSSSLQSLLDMLEMVSSS